MHLFFWLIVSSFFYVCLVFLLSQSTFFIIDLLADDSVLHYGHRRNTHIQKCKVIVGSFVLKALQASGLYIIEWLFYVWYRLRSITYIWYQEFLLCFLIIFMGTRRTLIWSKPFIFFTSTFFPQMNCSSSLKRHLQYFSRLRHQNVLNRDTDILDELNLLD